MVLSIPARKIIEKNIASAVAVLLIVAVIGDSTTPLRAQKGEKKFGDVIVRGYADRSKVKTHKIKLFGNRSYRITVLRKDASLKTVLSVQDSSGKLLTQTSGVGSATLDFDPAKDAVYQLIVRSTNTDKGGVYTLTINAEEGFRTVVHTGQLTLNDALDRVRRGCRAKIFPVRFRAGQTYIIDLEGNYDPYLRLEDSRGNNLKQDDDGGVGLNSRMTYQAGRTDMYRIIVTSCGQNRVGNYKLTVRRKGAGKTVYSTKGKLSKNDAKDRVLRGSYSRVHTVAFVGGRQYTIDLTSGQFDAYLRLEQAAGATLTSNNNSGVGTNARITYQSNINRVYRIVVTSATAGQSGAYSLVVREQ